MTAKFRMSVKLTRDQRRLLKRLAKQTGMTMTDVIVRGIGFVESAMKAQQIAEAGGGDVPDTRFLQAIPHALVK